MRLPLDAADLGSFGRQIVNQALLIEDESDYWTVDPIRVTIGHSKISRDFRIAQQADLGRVIADGRTVP